MVFPKENIRFWPQQPLLLLICIWRLGLPCFAQLPDYHLQYFDYSSGIRPGNIEGLHKDKDGFMWIIYPRSVQRFDGQRVQDFKPGRPVINLANDTKGRLWMAVQGGVQVSYPYLQRWYRVGQRHRPAS